MAWKMTKEKHSGSCANKYQSVILRMQAPVYSHKYCATSEGKNQQKYVEVEL